MFSVRVTVRLARGRVMVQLLAQLLAELLPATHVELPSERQPALLLERWLGMPFRCSGKVSVDRLLPADSHLPVTQMRREYSEVRTPVADTISPASRQGSSRATSIPDSVSGGRIVID